MSLDTAKISTNGQVSIPAHVRRRWNVGEVLVIDKGDRLIIRPVPADPFATIAGKYAAADPSEVLRSRARDEDAERFDEDPRSQPKDR